MDRAGFWAVLAISLSLDCVGDEFRLPGPDKVEKLTKTADVKTVGDVTSVYGTHAVQLYGVGIVRGLAGTGSDPKPGPARRAALRYLKERGVKNAHDFLASPETAVVLVRAVLMPGVQRGQEIDVDVELDPTDDATSLRGGELLPCDLREYADAHQLRGNRGPHQALAGRVLARAQGKLIVSLSEPGSEQQFRQARIWSGARSRIDRNFGLILKSERDRVQGAKLAKLIADRINARFFGPMRGSMRGMAEAKNHTLVTLRIPKRYRYNWPRYLRVVRQIPLRTSAIERSGYLFRLGDDLLDPAKTVVAALKLEALGRESIEPLQQGLHHENPLVRFCAAESLAYLGDPAGAETLAALCDEEPKFRAFALTALASLGQTAAQVQLRMLLASPSAETRVGAFRALYAIDPSDPAIAGVTLASGYHVHRAAPTSTPLVHISASRRPEIVLFGEEPSLLPPFAFQLGSEFVVTAAPDDDSCHISRITTDGTVRESCSLQVSDVLAKLGEMEATYTEAVELLVQASRGKNLACPVEVDALPQAPTVYELASQGLQDRLAADKESSETESIFLGLTPNLFAKARKRPGGDRSP